MARSRTDELLEGWKMIAHSARRPATAPRRQISRNGLSAGTLVAVVVAIVVIIALSSRGSSPAPQPTLPAVGEPRASASFIPSVVPSTPPSSAPASTPPEPTPTAGTPTAADLAAARSAINTYTADLVRGDYAAAWAMLGPEDPLRQGTLAQYSSTEQENFKDLKGEYTITVSPAGIAPITSWTSGISAAPLDLAHAVLVEVDYTVLAGNNAGYNLFIVNPTPTGLKIYDVR